MLNESIRSTRNNATQIAPNSADQAGSAGTEPRSSGKSGARSWPFFGYVARGLQVLTQTATRAIWNWGPFPLMTPSAGTRSPQKQDEPITRPATMNDDIQSNAGNPPLQAPQTGQTATYWKEFSDSIENEATDRLKQASAAGIGHSSAINQKPNTQTTPVNSSGVECIRNPAHALTLSLGQDNEAKTQVYLHGHQGVFTDSQLALAQSPDKPAELAAPSRTQTQSISSDAPPSSTGAGRSSNPGHEWLLYALQSKRSALMQFVSRKSHRDGSNGAEVPLLQQLQEALERGSVKLDDKHTLVEISPPHDKWVNGVGHKEASITVEVEQNGVKTKKEIQLTQVAPPFENRLLTADDLRTVYSICQQQQPDLDKAVMFSYAGVGRNATLAVYDQLVKAIDNGAITTTKQLEDSIKALVKSGRSIHHTHFVHSDKQLAEIFKAARQQLDERLVDAAKAPASVQASAATASRQTSREASFNSVAHDSSTSRNLPAQEDPNHSAGTTQPSAGVDQFNDDLSSLPPSPRQSQPGLRS